MLHIEMSGAGGKGIKTASAFTFGSASTEYGPTLLISTTGARLNDGTNTGGSSGGGGWPGGWGPGGGGHGGGASSGSSSKGIKAQGQATVYGGQLHITTTQDGAEGLESKTSVEIAGGQHYFKCYDDCINSPGIVKFSGGTTVCWSNGNDAIDSNYGRSGAITLSGGNVFAYTTKGSPEEGLDCDNNQYITISGGVIFAAGGSQGGGWGGSSSSVGSSTQGYYLGNPSLTFSASNYYTLCSTTGEALCTVRFGQQCSSSLTVLSAPNLGKGSFTLRSGSQAPTSCSVSVEDVFFLDPQVVTTATAKTLTAK